MRHAVPNSVIADGTQGNGLAALAPPRTQRPDDAAAIRNAAALWAESCTGGTSHRREELLHDKQTAVESFFSYTNKDPAQVGPLDVKAWCAWMEGENLKPNTIYTRVSRLSSFYTWLMKHPAFGAQISHNPAQLARPKCPKPYQTDSPQSYTDEEMKALLAVVKKEADAGQITAKRDYALLLIYFLTGMRRTEVIRLRGSDIELPEDGALILKYKRKGGSYRGREVQEEGARDALFNYLAAAGRKSVLGTARPLWTRHDYAGKSGAPLTSHALAKNLKRYARAANVKDARLHRMRHTFARIVAEESGSMIETQDALDHENIATTRVYVARITVKRDKHSRAVANRIKA